MVTILIKRLLTIHNLCNICRALKKKIRAEEMLKASSLPPSMAARQKIQKRSNNTICPRSYRSMDVDAENVSAKKSARVPDYQAKHEQLDLELEDLKNDFITTTPRPFHFQTARRHEKMRSRSVMFILDLNYLSNVHVFCLCCFRRRSVTELENILMKVLPKGHNLLWSCSRLIGPIWLQFFGYSLQGM